MRVYTRRRCAGVHGPWTCVQSLTSSRSIHDSIYKGYTRVYAQSVYISVYALATNEHSCLKRVYACMH